MTSATPPRPPSNTEAPRSARAAGLSAGAAQAGRWARWVRVGLRWLEHGLAAAAALVILLLLSPLPNWLYGRLDRQDPLRQADYIICLGGVPSRIIESARLLNEGYADKLVVSNRPAAASMMRDLAADWGAPAERILLDTGSYNTADHPRSVQAQCGVDPANDTVIVVTSYEHLARAKACFEKAGYRHVVMREPRWERQFRPRPSISRNLRILPELLYEGAAFVKYWLAGHI